MRRNSYVRRRISQSGVAEVVGTILILAMTVVLFATIIIWVASIPTPQASIRLDMDGTLTPFFDQGGTWDGVNITVRHRGGETLFAFRTQIIFTVQKPDNSFQTTVLRNRGTEFGVAYGIDGPDEDWHTGETWRYTNNSVDAEDRVTITVIDNIRSLILWNEPLKGPEGVHPPLFLEKWADRLPNTPTIDSPQTNREFTIFAKVADQDGDLVRHSVYVYLAFLYGTPEHRAPQRMYDDGTNGDARANDGVFTAKYSFFRPSSLNWDGGVVIFNATDLQGHTTTSRMTLEVTEGPASTRPPRSDFGSGRPPNLNYNGLQGFNIFNGTEWDASGFNATETRTFRESEEVVVVVGSAILKDTFGKNSFLLYDPFSTLPLDPVVYGTDKTVTASSRPSSTQAFEFLLFVNGYNVWILRFELNNASSVGINFHKTPARPPQYYFATYPLDIEIIDFLGNRFFVSDSVNITADDGTIRNYPVLETYSDSAYTTRTNTFLSTDVIYVQVKMGSVDGSPFDSVVIGNLVIQDFLGGTQLFRAPKNGHFVNPPICPVTSACTTGANIVTAFGSGYAAYRFSINLTLADQDPWVEGLQHYSFRLMSIRDSDEEYALVLSAQLVIRAPLYRMDVAVGVGDTQNQAWGTHDVSYTFTNRNGVDKWKMDRLHSGFNKGIDYTKAISFLDFDLDADLDAVASLVFQGGQPIECPNNCIFLYRQDRDADGNMVWTRSTIEVTGNVLVNDIRTGSLNKDLAPEIVAGASNGHVWYYKNDGSWTKTMIDTTRADAVNAIDIGDFNGDTYLDVVVARAGGKITYYLNLDGNGKFTTTEQTDQWYADMETTPPTKGTIQSGSYLDTFADDDVREVLREAQVSQSATWDNRTAEADHSTGPGQITAGSYVNTQTQDDVREVITETTTTGTRKALTHKWRMTLPPSGTKTFYLDAHRSAGSDDTFTFAWSTDDSTYTNLVTVTATTDTNSYLTATIPSGTSGTVYIRVQDSQQTNGEVTDSIRVDHMYVETFYAAGQVSALEHYWRIQQLPNRPSSTYTFYVRALRDDVGAEGDNFRFAYSTTGQSGTYTDTVLVNQGTETLFSYNLPALGGQVVWVRVLDTDRTPGATQLATLSVDRMYIEVFTPGGQIGSDINLPTVPGNAIALDAGNYDEDGFDDVFVGTDAGKLYRLKGSSGGLQPPGTFFKDALGTIGGVKIGNVTQAAAGLEVVVASNTLVRVFDSTSGALLSSTDVTPNGKTITTLTLGDVDGDGDDDIIVGTDGQVNAAANVVYHRNNPGGWFRILINDTMFAKIWDMDLGDLNKSQYMGR